MALRELLGQRPNLLLGREIGQERFHVGVAARRANLRQRSFTARRVTAHNHKLRALPGQLLSSHQTDS